MAYVGEGEVATSTLSTVTIIKVSLRTAATKLAWLGRVRRDLIPPHQPYTIVHTLVEGMLGIDELVVLTLCALSHV